VDVPALSFGNTDDHPNNLWMFRDMAGFRLTPALDLAPNTGARREPVLLFDLSPLPPGPSELAALGRCWGIAGSARVVKEVTAALLPFADVARSHAVPAAEIRGFERDIQSRLLACAEHRLSCSPVSGLIAVNENRVRFRRWRGAHRTGITDEPA
jgi:hypothetical protein